MKLAMQNVYETAQTVYDYLKRLHPVTKNRQTASHQNCYES